jgi:hypothetical protein
LKDDTNDAHIRDDRLGVVGACDDLPHAPSVARYEFAGRWEAAHGGGAAAELVAARQAPGAGLVTDADVAAFERFVLERSRGASSTTANAGTGGGSAGGNGGGGGGGGTGFALDGRYTPAFDGLAAAVREDYPAVSRALASARDSLEVRLSFLLSSTPIVRSPLPQLFSRIPIVLPYPNCSDGRDDGAPVGVGLLSRGVVATTDRDGAPRRREEEEGFCLRETRMAVRSSSP